MTTLSIRHTLTGIGQTGVDLVRCAQVGLYTKNKIALGICSGLAHGTSTLSHCIMAPVGRSAISTGGWFLVQQLGGISVLASTLSGMHGARHKAPWAGALGGALVGLTATGCSMLAESILGGGTVGLTSSAVRLAAGASGGALVAIATAHATKSSFENKYLFSSLGMGMLGGVLLGASVSGGLVWSGGMLTPEIIGIAGISNLVLSEVIVGTIGLSSLEGQLVDSELIKIIQGCDPAKGGELKALLDKKDALFPCNLRADSLSYNELLTRAIECKAPADWFKMLLERPGIDLNLKHHITGKTLLEHITAELKYAPKEIIYWKYLKHLLEYNSSNFMQDDNDKTPSFQVILEIIAKQNTDSQGDNNKNTDNIPGSKEVLMQDIERIINNHGIQSHQTKNARKIGSEADHHPIPTDNDAPSTTPPPPDNNRSDSVTLGDSHHEVANHDLIDTPKWCSLL